MAKLNVERKIITARAVIFGSTKSAKKRPNIATVSYFGRDKNTETDELLNSYLSLLHTVKLRAEARVTIQEIRNFGF